MYMSRIRGPYVRFCERDEAVTPHPTRCACSLRTVTEIMNYVHVGTLRAELGSYLISSHFSH